MDSERNRAKQVEEEEEGGGWSSDAANLNVQVQVRGVQGMLAVGGSQARPGVHVRAPMLTKFKRGKKNCVVSALAKSGKWDCCGQNITAVVNHSISTAGAPPQHAPSNLCLCHALRFRTSATESGR